MAGSECGITLGMPVYNGERYLREALDGLLAQDSPDFSLYISDNASTDATEQICREYAARDSRIRYLRHDANRGAVWNFNHVFGVSQSEFFAWAACDDRWEPGFLRACLGLLRAHPEAVLAHPRFCRIDASGKTYAGPFGGFVADSLSPRHRRRAVISDWYFCFSVYGVYRSSALRRTGLARKVYGSDHALIAEISLLGHILEDPGVLFFHRTVDPGESRSSYAERVRRGLDPAGKPGSYRFPLASLGREHLRTALRAPFSFSYRLTLVGDVIRRYYVHWIAIPALGCLITALLGRRGSLAVVRFLRKFNWYRRWRRVPEGLC